jgi:serine/threonine protein kinase
MNQELSANATLSHYRIVSKIGAGGMGEVYLAEDLKLGRRVALKVLNRELTESPDRLQRFEREARAASALNHPNILTVYEIGESEGVRFIATEFIEGDSLRQRMTLGAVELVDVLDVGIQIAAALAAAHEAGIVHRDIKPENIMVRKDRLVKVLDFGLAKLLKQDASDFDHEAETRALLKTSAGVVMGTTAYMSPEQTRGRDVDERTDIWSLGVVLHHLVTGELPFAGDTKSDVIASILKTEPPPLVHKAELVPRELEHIVNKALRKNRDDRYQHVKDLLIDLKDCKQELEFLSKQGRSLAPEQSTSHRSWQTAGSALVETASATDLHTTSSAEYIVSKIKRHKLGAITSLAVFIGLLTLGVFFYSQYSAAGDQKGIDSLAVLPFANDTGDPEMEYLSDGLSENLINNLSQLPSLKKVTGIIPSIC